MMTSYTVATVTAPCKATVSRPIITFAPGEHSHLLGRPSISRRSNVCEI